MSSPALFANALEDAEKVIFDWNNSPPTASRSTFFKAVTKLTELSRTAQASSELVELKQDKLRYYNTQLEQGEIEQKGLWPLAEALTKVRRTASADAQAYNVALETISRQWGGEQWWLALCVNLFPDSRLMG